MAVAFDILARADAVEVAGSYIGFFEWCVFACRLRRRVIVVFGGEDVDVLMHFAPDLCCIWLRSTKRLLARHLTPPSRESCTHWEYTLYQCQAQIQLPKEAVMLQHL